MPLPSAKPAAPSLLCCAPEADLPEPAPAPSPPPGGPPRAGRGRGLVALLISLGAAAWFAADVRWGPLEATLRAVRPPWVLAAVGLLLFEFVLRAWRWQVLLRPGGPVPLRHLLVAQIIGAAANTVLPLRAGELAKPWVAARRTGRPISTVVATAVMERIYDLFGLLTVLVTMAAVLPSEAQARPEHAGLVLTIKAWGAAFGGIALTCMGVFFVLATREQAARGRFLQILRLGPPAVRPLFLGLFDGFVAGLGNTRDLRGLAQAAALSAWLWFDGALAIWCLFQAFSMELPFGAACFTASAIALTVALPQAPGFLGVFHVAMEKTIQLWGEAEPTAEGFALVFWAVSFLPVTSVGLLAWAREGLRVGELVGDGARPGPAAPPLPPGIDARDA